MLLKWAAVIGYMYAKGRPFYSNDVIWLHQVTVPLYQETVLLFELNQIQSKWFDTKLHFIRNSQLYTIREIETQNIWFTQMPFQGKMGGKIFLLVLPHIGFLWNNLWSVSRYIMWPFSGPWRLGGNDQQCLAAPIWKYRSGIGDHRFTFFINLLPNYAFYTNLTNIVHWVVAYRDVAHLITLNLGKVEKNMQNRLMPV